LSFLRTRHPNLSDDEAASADELRARSTTTPAVTARTCSRRSVKWAGGDALIAEPQVASNRCAVVTHLALRQAQRLDAAEGQREMSAFFTRPADPLTAPEPTR